MIATCFWHIRVPSQLAGRLKGVANLGAFKRLGDLRLSIVNERV